MSTPLHAGVHPQEDTPPPEQTLPFAYYGIRSTSGQYPSYWNAFLLPPAMKLGQGYIFTGVCDSVCGGGSAWAGTSPRDQVHLPRPGTPPRTRYIPRDQVYPPGPGTPPGTRCTPRTRYTPPRSSACREIRATSGRYASYWNAFLLGNCLHFAQ